jgi:kynurenine 3-monooxygenase
MVFGADGAESPSNATPKHVQLLTRILNIGYKELNIPANPDGSHKLDKNSFIFPLREHMLIALPNLDGSFTCNFIYAFEGEILSLKEEKML